VQENVRFFSYSPCISVQHVPSHSVSTVYIMLLRNVDIAARQRLSAASDVS